jgi:hypothetical protein
VTAVVTGPADLCRGPEQGAGLARVVVALPKVDAISAEPFRQRHDVVDDKGAAMVCAQPLQRCGEPGEFVLADLFYPKLEGRDRATIQRRPQPTGRRRRPAG